MPSDIFISEFIQPSTALHFRQIFYFIRKNNLSNINGETENCEMYCEHHHT
jgi:hypothetical protein